MPGSLLNDAERLTAQLRRSALTSRATGDIVRPRGGIAVLVPNLPAQRREHINDGVELVAQAFNDGTTLTICAPLYRLALVESLCSKRTVFDEPAVLESLYPAVELVLRPGPRPGVCLERQPPVQLGHQANLDGVEASSGPGGRVRVAAILAKPVGETPRRAQGRGRHLLGEHSCVQRPARDRQRGAGSAEGVTQSCDARWFGSEDPGELCDGTLRPSLPDGACVGQ